MPEYVLNRDYDLVSKGYVVNFKKGVPASVAPLIEREAAAIGAERVDGDTVSPLAPAIPEPQDMDAEQVREAILAAFDLLVEENTPADFTANGTPSVAAVRRVAESEQITATDVRDLWAEYRVAKGL